MSEREPDTRPPSRRSFLKASGIAAAGVVVGGGAGAATGAAIGHAVGLDQGREDFTARDPRPERGVEHIVVVMGENRSFDNLLGYLYTRDDIPAGERFDGLAFGDYSNRAPDGTVVSAHPYSGPTDTVMRQPDPDPGEEYPHVNTQIYGTVRPVSNAGREVDAMQFPFNAPGVGDEPSMSGFLEDYISETGRMRGGKVPSGTDSAHIMGSFTPEMLPVISTLAKNFAVYDSWHAAVPSQTFCNRSFFHASTSHGFVTNKHNGGYEKWLQAPASPTIFNRLEDAGLDWRIYFDESQLVSLTGVLHAPALQKYWRTDHFALMSQFYDDAKKGKLAPYSFIEPRLVYDHNDFHPPVGPVRESDFDGQEVTDSAISDVRAGDALVHRIYDAVRRSDTSGGSNALNTLLLITFDEHGGTYDHVPPSSATPPGSGGAGEMGFTFDRLGCRVPAIAVSAWTPAGRVINDAMHHGSVIATLTRVHGLEPLSRRDAGANDLLNALTLSSPRHPSTWPVTTPAYVPANPEKGAPEPGSAERNRPLSPPGRGLLGMLLAKYARGEREPQTYGEAYDLLQTYGNGLFGVPR